MNTSLGPGARVDGDAPVTCLPALKCCMQHALSAGNTAKLTGIALSCTGTAAVPVAGTFPHATAVRIARPVIAGEEAGTAHALRGHVTPHLPLATDTKP